MCELIQREIYSREFNMSSIVPDERLDSIVVSNHKFMVQLYGILAEREENVFFSPFSIYVALVLVYLGSKNATEEELKKCLFAPKQKEQWLESFAQFLNRLKHPELNTATEMFVEQTYKVRTSFKEDAKKFVNSDSQVVDFRNAAHKATELINSWVSSQTNNKIHDLIPSDALDNETRLVLVNAIHFKDAWLEPFQKTGTYSQKFYTSAESFSSVDMMHLTKTFPFKEEDTFKILVLPYKNENFKMVILLPNEIDGLADLEKRLPELRIADAVGSAERKKVQVALPKFKLEKRFDLNEVLQKTGVNKMFNDAEADLTGINEPSEYPLCVSKVFHKAFVEVNEEGTEAAAATACIIRKKRSCFIDHSEDFIADHPFVYFIMSNDIVLFVGRMKIVS